ncbi:MAG: hypothetical protein ACYCS0_01390 [bacterium]
MREKKSFYLSTGFYEDERIMAIDSPEKGKILYFWLRLAALAAKYEERENLKNCLKRKNLPVFFKDETVVEFFNSALETLEKLNLLDIKAIDNLVRFEGVDYGTTK